jgi:hypothetical protein
MIASGSAGRGGESNTGVFFRDERTLVGREPGGLVPAAALRSDIA